MELNGFCAAIIFIRFEGFCKNNKYYAWWLLLAGSTRRLRLVEAEMTTDLMKKLVNNSLFEYYGGLHCHSAVQITLETKIFLSPSRLGPSLRVFPCLATGSEDSFYLISVQVKTGLTTTFSSSSKLEVVSGSVTTESDSSEDVSKMEYFT